MQHDALLTYYERELSHLRHLGQEFGQAYPKVAGRLLLEAGKCEDPHVERLIQAVAFLTRPDTPSLATHRCFRGR
jgi:type VI secretion system protein ImpG